MALQWRNGSVSAPPLCHKYSRRWSISQSPTSASWASRFLGDRAKVAIHRSGEGSFCIGADVLVPPRSEDLFEFVGSQRVRNVFDLPRVEREIVRIASHEADVTAVWKHLYYIA